MQEIRLGLSSHPHASGTLHLVSFGASERRAESFTVDVLGTPIPDSGLLDGAVIAALPRLMAIGAPVRIEGAMSRQALSGLSDWQALWARWRPGVLRRIELRPSSVQDVLPSSTRAVSLFSGGVDATFTALRHAALLPPAERETLTGLAMVHGADLPLDEDGAFGHLVERTRPLREALGLELHVLRTDLRRTLQGLAWDDTHAAQLVGCLHFLSGRYGVGIIAGAEPVDRMPIVYGSSPTVDPLLSGGRMRIRHDGVAWTRPDKIASIASFPGATEGLRVCWEDGRNPRNCGVCEKCLRTRLSFRAAGAAEPDCFDRPFDAARIARIPLYPQMARTYRDILAHARAKGCKGDWVDALAARLWHFDWIHHPLSVPLQAAGRMARQKRVRRTLERIPGFAGGLERLRGAARRAVRLNA